MIASRVVLLDRLYKIFLLRRQFISKKKYRAQHEDDRDDLDLLVDQGYIFSNRDDYEPTILGLKATTIPEAQRKLRIVRSVFLLLRDGYKKNPGKEYSFLEIAVPLKLDVYEAKFALHMLSHTTSKSIFGSSAIESDSSLVTRVTPSESILDFKSFDIYLEEQKPWVRETTHKKKTSSQSDIFLPGIYDLDSFEEFESRIESLNQALLERKRSKPGSVISSPLFRGHADADWKLESTLERVVDFPLPTDAYSREIRKIYKRLQVFTDKKWNMDFEVELSPIRKDIHVSMELYELMIYLRHHGYPSPLLDWSESPYVAAFFAFNSMRKIKKEANDKVSIFVYLDDLGNGKSRWEGDPYVENLGPNVVAHKRHHIQQCEYTLCFRRSDLESGTQYWAHEDFFERGEKEHSILQKFTIPFKERLSVLNKLKLMNINQYTLFTSEDSLVQSLGLESFVLNDI